MSFQPAVPLGGLAGWSFLARTREAQQEAFAGSTVIQRNLDYFRDNIGNVQTAEELVNDRRLLTVALGAFGLSDDIANKFFIQKVLSEGTLDDESFANKLADKRYFAMAEAFGFDLQPPNTVISTFADGIEASYVTREFEVAVGDQDESLRLALSLERELPALADRGLSEEAAWFTIMGTPPLRAVFEGALGLPTQTGALDIERQLEIFQDKSLTAFGTSNPLELTTPEAQEELIRKFLLRSEINAQASLTAPGSVALSLLQSQVPLFP
ncbi:MAG: DUF1217 domain-containing protein [Pseudomonadota bacterium]